MTGRIREAHVQQPEKNRRDDDETEYHQGGHARLLARGPHDLAQLDAGVQHELPEIAPVLRPDEQRRAQDEARHHDEPALPGGLGGEHVVARDACQDQQDRDCELRLVQRPDAGFCVFCHVDPMAGQEGIEPPTCGFGDRRSAN